MPGRAVDPDSMLLSRLQKIEQDTADLARQMLPITVLASAALGATLTLPGNVTVQTLATASAVNGYLNYHVTAVAGLENAAAVPHNIELSLWLASTAGTFLQGMVIPNLAAGFWGAGHVETTYQASSRAIQGGLVFVLGANGDGAAPLRITSASLFVKGVA